MGEKKGAGMGGMLGVLALMMILLICCGGPLVVALVGTAGIGAVLAGAAKYWIVSGILLIAGMGGGIMWARGRGRRRADCCTSDDRGHNDTSCCHPPFHEPNARKMQ
jgi:hypothetical protein